MLAGVFASRHRCSITKDLLLIPYRYFLLAEAVCVLSSREERGAVIYEVDLATSECFVEWKFNDFVIFDDR